MLWVDLLVFLVVMFLKFIYFYRIIILKFVFNKVFVLVSRIVFVLR